MGREVKYTDFYTYFGDEEKKEYDNFKIAFKKRGKDRFPVVLLQKLSDGIKVVKQRSVPKSIQAARKSGEIKELTEPPYEIKDGETIYDLSGNAYTFNYDKIKSLAIITKHNNGEKKQIGKKTTKKQDGDNTYYETVVEDTEELNEMILEHGKEKKKDSSHQKYTRGIRKEASFKGIVREYEVVDSKTNRYVDEGIIKKEDIKYDQTAKKIINIYPRSSRYYIHYDKSGGMTKKYDVNKKANMNPEKTRWAKFDKERAKVGNVTERKRINTGKQKISTKPPVTTKSFKMNIIPKTKNTNKITKFTGISVSIPKLGKLKLKSFKQPRIKL